MQAQVCVIGIKGKNTGDIVLQRGVRGRFFDVKTHLNVFMQSVSEFAVFNKIENGVVRRCDRSFVRRQYSFF